MLFINQGHFHFYNVCNANCNNAENHIAPLLIFQNCSLVGNGKLRTGDSTRHYRNWCWKWRLRVATMLFRDRLSGDKWKNIAPSIVETLSYVKLNDFSVKPLVKWIFIIAFFVEILYSTDDSKLGYDKYRTVL